MVWLSSTLMASLAQDWDSLSADHRRLELAGGGEGEDLVAGLGDADGMFALGRQRLVAGDRRPAVGQQLHRIFAEVHHRLDGEEHARPQQLAGPLLAEVQ